MVIFTSDIKKLHVLAVEETDSHQIPLVCYATAEQRQRQRCTETATANGNGETATEWWKPGISVGTSLTGFSRSLEPLRAR